MNDRDLYRLATDHPTALRHRRRAGMETARQQKRAIKREQRRRNEIERTVETVWQRRRAPRV